MQIPVRSGTLATERAVAFSLFRTAYMNVNARNNPNRRVGAGCHPMNDAS